MTEIFLIKGPPLLTLKSWESWIEDKMTSKTQMQCVLHAPKLVCSTGVSNFQTSIQPSAGNRSVLNVNNGGPWNPKVALKENSLLDKIRSSRFCQSGACQANTLSKSERKREEIFLNHSRPLTLIEQVSVEGRKTKTKVITLANQKGRRQSNKPIKTRSNYMQPTQSAGKCARPSHDWFWFHFCLVDKMARDLWTNHWVK